MADLKRKLVVFNEDDEHQRELLEWCATQTSNFSGFVKHVLFAYKSGLTFSRNSNEFVPEFIQPATDKYSNIDDIL